MKDLDIFSVLAQRHGHYCPMSTLGLRLGLDAVRRLAGTESTHWWFCYQARTCASDGIALALENSCLSVDLKIEQHGQHLLLCRSTDGRELSLGLSDEAMQLALCYRDLDETAQLEHLEMLRQVDVERIIDVTGFSS